MSSLSTSSTKYEKQNSNNIMTLQHHKSFRRRHYYFTSSTITTNYPSHNHKLQLQLQNKTQYNLYHTSTKKEILPLIAVGTLAFVGTYSYKALKRMDQEWEEYEEALKEYKLEHGLTDDDDNNNVVDHSNSTKGGSSKGNSSNVNANFRLGKMAIDLGSVNIRIAQYQHQNINNKNNKPNIIINREGRRSTPNSIIIDTDESILSGTMASAKIYERSKSNNPVINPYELLWFDNNNNNSSSSQGEKIAVNSAIANLAKDALERTHGSHHPPMQFLFSVDSNYGYNVQPIFTYPPPSMTNGVSNNDNDEDYLHHYKEYTSNLVSSTSIASFVPEPISALRGARYYDILPTAIGSSSSMHMVIDIGGKTTSITLVDETNTNNNDNDYKIKYHTCLHGFGGESIVEALMNRLSKSFYGTEVDKVADTMGIQRLYDSSKSAVMEMGGAKHGRVQINIPYLSVDEKMQPKHLDVGLSTKVLEAEFDDLIKRSIVPNLAKDQNVLSDTMTQPVDLQSLLGNMVMKVFEKSGQNPFALSSVLIVGGGVRNLYIQRAMKAALGQLAGEQFVQEKVVIPKDSLAEELVVLGATL